MFSYTIIFIGVQSLPNVLFSKRKAKIVEFSTLFLYCVINSSSHPLKTTWTKDGAPVIPSSPHIRIRKYTSEMYATLLLIVDSFQRSDDGDYQCTAEVRGKKVYGNALNLKGIVATISQSSL